MSGAIYLAVPTHEPVSKTPLSIDLIIFSSVSPDLTNPKSDILSVFPFKSKF